MRTVPLLALALLAAASAASAQPAKPVVPPKPDTPAQRPPEGPKKTPPGPDPHSAAFHGIPAAPAPKLKLDVRREKLDNGLRVVLAPDHTSPTIAVDVVYDVGGRNEERGKSGFAHLFEHMMFQGSRNIARGEHFKLVSGHGGTLNGTTNSDRTNYYEMLPQSELALALWLEADRMKALDVSQKNFENQRAVVKEEYRMRVENAAYVPAEIRLEELVFQGYWPYEHSAIGTMKDLDAAELDWVRAFHDAYYAPNDAVVSIAGDFDPDQALAMVRRYFGSAKAQPNVPKYEPGAMPEPTAPKDDVVLDPHAKLPASLLGWPTPPSREADHYALELAAMLLADGESSRLYKQLVRDKAVAIEVDADLGGHRGPDYFGIETKLAKGAKIGDVEKMIEAELQNVAKNGPTDEEMRKLRARMESRFLLGLQSNFARAQRLAEFEVYWGDASLLNGELARYVAVTKADIQRAVGKYLVPARRTRVEVKPQEKEAKK
jgi:predicted Zn-dependent peptidase